MIEAEQKSDYCFLKRKTKGDLSLFHCIRCNQVNGSRVFFYDVYTEEFLLLIPFIDLTVKLGLINSVNTLKLTEAGQET